MSVASSVLQLASNGLGHPEIAGTVLRVAIGSFFACSGFNKLTNKPRHAGLIETFKADRIPFIPFMQWWVPGWEFTGGAMLAAGLFPTFAALVLLVICAVACFSEASSRVDAYKPINGADRWADYLYLPEVLYAVVLVAVILA
jgi:putative oxidoreductase